MSRNQKIPGAFVETYAILTTRPDGKKYRPGEYCDSCGARSKKKRHQRIGKKFLCEKCLSDK